MNPHERFEPDDPREWMRRAKSNLSQARNRTPDIYLEDLCFVAQQATEKAIKAVMIARDIEFPYVHNLAHLLDVLEETGEPIPEDIRAAETLTRYASATPYPNMGSPVSLQEYTEAIRIADAVVQWAEAAL